MSTESRPDQPYPPADLRPDAVTAMLAAAIEADPAITSTTPVGILRGLVEYGPVWAENPDDPRGQLVRLFTGMLSQGTRPEGQSDG